VSSDDPNDLWGSILNNPKLPYSLRLQAADKLMDRAFGRPAVAMTVDQASREMAIKDEVRNLSHN
jgi:hypothetical protein